MNLKSLMRVLSLLIAAASAGCAPAYHSYSGACVPCRYCAPQPLAYGQYGECVCHSAAAAPYLAIAPRPAASGEITDEAGWVPDDVRSSPTAIPKSNH